MGVRSRESRVFPKLSNQTKLVMKNFILCLLFLGMFQTSNAQKTETLQDLRADIDSVLALTEGNFAVAFRDIASGEQLLINEKKEFHAASTMKTTST
mgnify:CR=1 FL=1